MKIAIISDTHVEKDMNSLNKFLDKYIDGYDLIIHCGDYNSLEVVKTLNQRFNFIGVWGNNDHEDVKKALEEELIMEVNGYKIAIFHGHGEGKTTMERAYQRFAEADVDIIAFGHSHQSLIKTHKGVLMLNPGSPTNKRREKFYSFISIELEENEIKAQMIYYN